MECLKYDVARIKNTNSNEERNLILENLGCKPTYMVYATKNYSLFDASFDNRIDFKKEPTTVKYKRLKNSIDKFGKNVEPITVREIENGTRFEVVKGHHRYLACKHTNSELRFRIDNYATLDESIEEVEGVSPWTEMSLLERGIRHDIKLCTVINDMKLRFPRLNETPTITARLIWGYLGLKGYPKKNKLTNSLKSISGIQELKDIIIDDKDLMGLREFLFRFLETVDVCDQYYDEVRDNDLGYSKLKVWTIYAEVFVKNYKFVAKNYDDYIKEWEGVCKTKHNKNVTAKNKEVYKGMTSRDGKFIGKSIMDIYTRVEKFEI